jgi:hypothetical protein
MTGAGSASNATVIAATTREASERRSDVCMAVSLPMNRVYLTV